MPSGSAAVVRSLTRLTAVPFVPELRLHLAVESSVDVWEAVQESAGRTDPPFWAFAWAGGLALARHLLDEPASVEGKRVLDVATGSGLVAVAAGLAGAAEVRAFDVDPLAVAAARLNAAANGVRVTVTVAGVDALPSLVRPGDLVLAGDVFYERGMAERMLTGLRAAHGAGAEVLVGDPLRTYLPRDQLEVLASYDVTVDPDLEDASVKPAVVARLTGG